VRRIHESVNEALAVVSRDRGAAVLDLDVAVQHSGYAPERFAALKKRERNLRLHRLTVADRPRDAYAWYRFGDELRAVDAREAMGALETAWRLLLELPRAERARHVYGPEIAALRALLTLDAGDGAAALVAADAGGAEAGWTPNLRYVKALIARRQGDPATALREYEALLRAHGKRTDAPIQPGITSILARLGEAECREAMGDLTGAAAALRAALEADPRGSRAARELARVLTAAGRAKEGREALDDYLKRNPNDGEAWAHSARLALAAGSPEIAVKRYQIAASAFDAPPWVLKELAEVKAMVGDLSGVLSTLERVKEAPRDKRPVQP
jgi:tetratricopeptide (TPR) repeat protein